MPPPPPPPQILKQWPGSDGTKELVLGSTMVNSLFVFSLNRRQ